ncbi:MAG: hypothetical protein ACFCUQ_16525 [Kiloniellales bacterium]
MNDQPPKGFAAATPRGNRVVVFPRAAAVGGGVTCSCSSGDGCRQAVTRTYRELRRRGLSDRRAFEAGLRLYGLRHPELPPAAARDQVAEWICGELGQ